jgi:bacterial/archaeal transporter family-2 protein
MIQEKNNQLYTHLPYRRNGRHPRIILQASRAGPCVETTNFRRVPVKSTLILAVLAGVCVAVQTSLTGAAQRTLGPLVLVAISGLTTGVFALLMSLVVAKPEFTGRAVGYAVTSGILGAVIVGSIAVAAGQAGVARALSLVIAAQLIAGLVLDALGVFGAGADFSILKALGVLLIIAGGVLVVSF